MPPKTSSRTRKASSPPRARRTRSQSVEVANVRGRQGSDESAQRANTGRSASRDLGAVDEDAVYDLPNNNSNLNVDDVEEEEYSGGSSQEISPSPEPSGHPTADEDDVDLSKNPANLQAFKRFANQTASASQDIDAKTAAANRAVTKAWMKSTAREEKENRNPQKRKLTDPHPAATKDAWTSDEDGSPIKRSQKQQKQSQQLQSRRRMHPRSRYVAAPPAVEDEEEVEDDEDDEDDFEQDNRLVDEARRVRAAPIAQLPKRIREQEHDIPSSSRRTEVTDDGRRALAVPSANPQKRIRRGEDPVPSQPNRSVVGRPTSQQMTQSEARAITQHVTLATRKVQVRRPWTQHDEELLVRLITEKGCSWATIAKLPENLAPWDVERNNLQVDLKDKARNLKVNFLITGQELPVNFDQVRLGKKELDRVHAVFPEYDQEAERLDYE